LPSGKPTTASAGKPCESFHLIEVLEPLPLVVVDGKSKPRIASINSSRLISAILPIANPTTDRLVEMADFALRQFSPILLAKLATNGRCPSGKLEPVSTRISTPARGRLSVDH
jgi:hypothetical protein